MQRLFSTFPHGRAGVGLALLRVSVAGSLVFNSPMLRFFEPWWMLIGFCVLALGLCVGILTPILSFSTSAVQIAGLVWLGVDPDGALLSIPAAVAIGLLGPGAYSLDGYLFGRRQLIWPTNQHGDPDP